MIKQINFVVVALLIVCVGATKARAQDDVFVNLSVLESLSADNVAVPNISTPQFPIVKKSSIVRKKRTPKIVAKKIKVVAKSQDLEKDKLASLKMAENCNDEKNIQPIPYVESSELVEVVDVEPSSSIKNENLIVNDVPSEAKVASHVSAGLTVEETKEEEKDSSTISSVAEAVNHKVKDTVEVVPSLLIDPSQTSQLQPSTKGVISFINGADALTVEQQMQIDAIISSFENPSVNKIAIYSYNLDDGIDSFKKKRLSLNRAVEIRSYLLPKGYKNFSIKVINVDVNSQKGNTVELEELKN